MPVAFQFETDMRSERRRLEFADKMKTWENRSTSNTSTNIKPIPNFKAIHSAQAALLASQRQEKIAPTVPVTPHFTTDERMAEREKFEEKRRARELELERQREEQRRAQEEEEEREWRELRKRAIPRANPVPEWYANAPRREGDQGR